MYSQRKLDFCIKCLIFFHQIHFNFTSKTETTALKRERKKVFSENYSLKTSFSSKTLETLLSKTIH